MPTAQIQGSQRTVVDHSIRPARLAHGYAGIPVRDGRTLPFSVTRSWSAPAGTYPETFYLIDPETREVLYEGPVLERSVWGLQSMTGFTTVVHDPIRLEPGTYAVVFALGGVLGGEFPVEAFDVVV